MSQPALKYYTEEEYLAFERASQERHEYYKGEVFAMSGASFKHNVIQINIITLLGNHLKGKACRPFGSDLRIQIPSNSLYTYPDVVIVCEEPKFADKEFDTILNPSVIVEILSTSTASYDRGDKFALYRKISSLKEYILVDSTSINFTSHVKNDDGTWTLYETQNLGDQFSIVTIDFKVSLSEVYAGTNA